MKPYYQDDMVSIYLGDCRDVVTGIPEVDTVMTDPPYGLNFMGKEWDHGVPGWEFWELIKLALKPGAMLLAFGSTRTFHRLTCSIEDAGFEIRDCLTWLYGSGFPKSLDISKAIDKAKGAEREVVGEKEKLQSYGYDGNNTYGEDLDRNGVQKITAPSTDLAKRWNGWGTALKPAWEPIILAMKPLDGTFAENAEKHGVAGLNISAGRIGVKSWAKEPFHCSSCASNVKRGVKHSALVSKESSAQKNVVANIKEKDENTRESTNKKAIGCLPGRKRVENVATNLNISESGEKKKDQFPEDSLSTTSTMTGSIIGSITCVLCGQEITPSTISQNTKIILKEKPNMREGGESNGRWPSNLLLDEDAAAMLDAQSGELNGTSGITSRQRIDGIYSDDKEKSMFNYGDNGGASRFFYVAKASSTDRGNRDDYEMPLFGTVDKGLKSTHPTVKPLDLMEKLIHLQTYLCKLTSTPTGGVILDPFLGSGTTLVAAKRAGRKAIGIEINEEYAEIAAKRLEAEQKKIA